MMKPLLNEKEMKRWTLTVLILVSTILMLPPVTLLLMVSEKIETF